MRQLQEQLKLTDRLYTSSDIFAIARTSFWPLPANHSGGTHAEYLETLDRFRFSMHPDLRDPLEICDINLPNRQGLEPP